MSQPVEVYPSPNTIPTQSSSHSKGSFGPVFIVLGVIVALTIVATVVGRICSRRHHGSKAEQPHATGGKKKAKSAKQHDKFQHGEGDIEFGFDKRIPTSKVADRGEAKGPKLPHNGDPKGHVRFSGDHIEFRAGP